MAEPDAFDSPGETNMRRLLERLGRLRQRSIPYIQQLSTGDCGAACLAMVLGYYGRAARLSEVRDLLSLERDELSALALLNAADKYGLRGRGVKMDMAELEYLDAGAILHWEFNHFVVFERLHRDGVDIIDPAVGRRRIRLDEFRRAFTGVALILEPTERLRPLRADARRIWRHIRQAAGPSRLWNRIVVTSALLQLLALAVPLLIGLLVDRVVPRHDLHLLAVLGAGFAALVVFQYLAAIIRSHLLLQLRTIVDATMTMSFVEHLVALPYSFFQRRPAGDLLMRLNSNAVVREIVTSGAISALLDGVLVSLYLIVLLVASLPIGVLALALGLMQVSVFLVTRGRQRRLMSESLQKQAQAQSYQFEMLAGIETFKALGSEHRAVERCSDLLVDTLNVSLERGRLDALVEAAVSALRLASPLLILGYGGLKVLNGDVSLGNMLALSALAGGFFGPLSALVSTAMQAQLLGGYLDRIDDVLATPLEQDRDNARPASRLRGGIDVEELSFRYAASSSLALRDVTVDIPPGAHVAIVGRSGAGKSTLASVLVGLYSPTSGRILYDGTDLLQLDLRSVRRQIGFVTQRPYLFGASIRDNIAFADPETPLDAVIEAATLARIHQDIMAMPMGYETMLGDGGTSLAGGQRQRLAIARALVRQPPILLLDEATSALDAVTEAEIHGALASLRCTRIVIAHRLSTVRRADVILVLDHGEVVERGSHHDLLARGGVYAELVSAQVESAVR